MQEVQFCKDCGKLLDVKEFAVKKNRRKYRSLTCKACESKPKVNHWEQVSGRMEPRQR